MIVYPARSGAREPANNSALCSALFHKVGEVFFFLLQNQKGEVGIQW